MTRHCGMCQHDKFALHGIQRYGHIFFVPIFPTEKVFFLTCQGCGGSMQYDDCAELISRHEEVEFKTPIMSYIGPLVIVILIAMGAISSLVGPMARYVIPSLILLAVTFRLTRRKK